MNVFDRVLYWCHAHRLSAIEVLNILVLIWWGAILATVPPEQIQDSPLDGVILGIMPFWGWVCIALGIACLKIAGVLTQHLMVLRVSAALAGSWWAAIGTIIIISTETYLTPSVYFIATASSLFRIAELSYNNAKRQRGYDG